MIFDKLLNLLNMDNWRNEWCEEECVDDLTFFEQAIALIMRGDLDDAYRMICKRNAELPTPPGMGCNWSEWYRNGLDQEQEDIYRRQLSTCDNALIGASSIYSQMSGEPIRKISSYLQHMHNIGYSVEVELRTENSRLSTEKNFESYRTAGIEKYRFCACLDNRTCQVCRDLNGKVFRVSQKQIGINCPPIHKGCRCTTVAEFSRELVEDATSSGEVAKLPSKSEAIQYAMKCERLARMKEYFSDAEDDDF